MLKEPTATGVEELELELLPSCPETPFPQHMTDPVVAPDAAPTTAHEKELPAAMSIALAIPEAATAAVVLAVVPFPS